MAKLIYSRMLRLWSNLVRNGDKFELKLEKNFPHRGATNFSVWKNKTEFIDSGWAPDREAAIEAAKRIASSNKKSIYKVEWIKL